MQLLMNVAGLYMVGERLLGFEEAKHAACCQNEFEGMCWALLVPMMIPGMIVRFLVVA